MELTGAEWQEYIAAMYDLRDRISAWPVTEPDPSALRCEFSRHRTLAHLRSAQETWLEAALFFAERDRASLLRPHPWRSFESRDYACIPWEDHMKAYLTDRAAWIALAQRPDLDRGRGGKLSRKPRTIESLTVTLISHERYHIEALEARMNRRQTRAS